MKKKTIEKIPYLTLPKVKREKKAEYVALTAIREIGGEAHLFVEVYRNRKDRKKIPAARIVLTQKDFGTCFPESGEWSRGRAGGDGLSRGLIWRESESGYETQGERKAKNILYSPEDLKRIQEFLPSTGVYDEAEWWEYINRRQDRITGEERRERANRKWQRRRQALGERIKQTEELPKERILNYADEHLFHNRHHLYYKRHGAWAAVACSKCGGVARARWKPGMSYESQFERSIEEPVMGMYGTCPLCGSRGKYIPQGRARSFYRESRYVFLGQKYKETGMVLRYVEVEKEWQLEVVPGEKGEEMHGSCEKLSGIEVARIYFEPGKKLQKDYHKHDWYSGKDFWDDCNLNGNNNIDIREGPVMPETYENMKGTFLAYSALKEYQEAETEDINPVDYLERYIETPQMEMLVKLNLIQVVRKLVSCRYGIVADLEARRPDLFLGIRKERVKQLCRHQGDIEILEAMQAEKRLGQCWREEQVEQLAELDTDCRIRAALEHMGIQQFLNRTAKYAGCEYGSMCSTAVSRLKETARTYLDYLAMRENLGYDMSNSVYLFPRELRAAHDKMVLEQNQKEADKRLREVAVTYPLIKKHYRRLRKQFYYEDAEFQIRPARDAGEIVMEGRILHHCVGGEDYLKKHNEGKTVILFLRRKEEPDMPYITVEIEPESLHILQWYGAHDRKPDAERMQKWLDAYVTRLKCAGKAAGQAGTEDGTQQLLAYA